MPHMKTIGHVALGIVCSVTCVVTFGSGGTVPQSSWLTARMGISHPRGREAFYQGEHLAIHVRLCVDVRMPGAPKTPVRVLGPQGSAWRDSVRVTLCQLSDRSDTTPARQSLEGRTRTKLEGVSARAIHEQREDMLKPNGSLWFDLYISPEDTVRMGEGDYVLTAECEISVQTEDGQILALGTVTARDEVILAMREAKGNVARAEVLESQGRFALYEGKNDVAIGLFKEEMNTNPDAKAANADIAQAYERKGDKTAAIRHYRAYVDWVRSLNLPRTGADDLNDSADRVERLIAQLEKALEKP
jgi:hypothetical protein